VLEEVMEKVEIFLEPEERAALEQMAKDAGLGVSEMVQSLLRERVKQNRRARRREAAKMMADAYQTDKELTAFSDLDGEA
jgi:post-segregation antitoxin (ccd killing protein)